MDARTPISEMSDRELLEELVTAFRFALDALDQLSSSPMLSMLGIKL